MHGALDTRRCESTTPQSETFTMNILADLQGTEVQTISTVTPGGALGAHLGSDRQLALTHRFGP
jgi:hypothetical protein